MVDKRFQITKDDRGFIVGQTGSGKTTLVKALLWKRRNMIVLDPKRTFTVNPEWEHETVVSLPELKRTFDHTKMVIYRPTYEELDRLCDDFFRYVFELENVLLYVDEVASVTTPRTISPYYGRCLKLGRELDISVWSATQRPRKIPLEVMTESQHFYIFNLTNIDDRKVVADYTTPEVLKTPAKGHGFHYYNGKISKSKYYKDFDKGKV